MLKSQFFEVQCACHSSCSRQLKNREPLITLEKCGFDRSVLFANEEHPGLRLRWR